MSNTDMNYLQAVSSVSALARDNQQLERQVEQLTTGAARQATTIRQLNEQLSAKETEVQVEQYNVEFVKQQARKTRVINREKIKDFKAKITSQGQTIKSLLDRNATLEAQVEHLRKQLSITEAARVASADQNETLQCRLRFRKKQIDALLNGQPAPPPPVTFITEAQAVQARMTREGNDHFAMTKTIRVDQLSMQMSFCDEHEGDLRIVEAIAQQAAKAMTAKLEDKIVETLMGRPMTRDERIREEYHMRMKQQRQTYGTRW